MAIKPIHCPLCNARKVRGLGLVIYQNTALVEYRCRTCGELFFMADQREQEIVQTLESSPSKNDNESHK